MKTLKNTLSLLLCLLLLASPVICSAATMSITEQELTKLEQAFAELKQNNSVLLSDSDASKLDLIRALKLLRESQDELGKLSAQLAQLKQETMLAKSDLNQASESLKLANQSFEAFAKEQKKIQTRLKNEKLIWMIVAGVAGYFAVSK